jgi:F-type H+-transporting ATPase subunit epsilon
MAETLKLEIVTPEAIVFSEDVEMVTLPSAEGELGILPGHVGLMTQLIPGEMIVGRGGHDEFLAVGEGLVEVTGKRVAILTDMAIAADRIDEAKVEEARQRAEARLREKISDAEVATVNASLARSLAQLRVRRRRRI